MIDIVDSAQSSQNPYAQWGGPLSQDPYNQGPLSLSLGMDTFYYAQPSNWHQPSIPANTIGSS